MIYSNERARQMLERALTRPLEIQSAKTFEHVYRGDNFYGHITPTFLWDLIH